MAARVTQTDVARMAGVSRQLVSLVVNDDPRVSPESRKAVLDAIERTGYRPNRMARSLAMARSGVIGVVVPDFQNAFFGELIQHIRAASEAEKLIPFATAAEGQEASAAIERFVDFGVDGLILVAPTLTQEQLDAYAKATPTVILTSSEAPESADLIRTDDQQGSLACAQTLTAGGFAPLAFIGRKRFENASSLTARAKGYRRAVEGMQEPIVVMLEGHEGDREIEKILDDLGPGSGIVAHDDALAFTIVSIALSRGMTLGHDLGITGFDNTYLSQFPGAQITSIDQGAGQMGQLAVTYILERQAGRSRAKQTVLPPRLMQRASSSNINKCEPRTDRAGNR
ncbi:MAG: LacI family DNA-binding transcriptional regulator [Actinomycetaceae bacterium]|nr:LacI family DNA-binding transcriptional regulator [Actinomycetaceae bacterium]